MPDDPLPHHSHILHWRPPAVGPGSPHCASAGIGCAVARWRAAKDDAGGDPAVSGAASTPGWKDRAAEVVTEVETDLGLEAARAYGWREVEAV